MTQRLKRLPEYVDLVVVFMIQNDSIIHKKLKDRPPVSILKTEMLHALEVMQL
jgi:hypothetical protein